MAVIEATSPPAPVSRQWYRHLYLQVVVAIALGVAVGHFWPATGEALKPIGDAFIKLVKMIIAPVIFLTIVTGIAGLRDLAAVGRVALKAMAYFLTLSTVALILGLVVGNVVKPGAGLAISTIAADPSKIADYAAKAHDSSISGFLLDAIPDTLVSALTAGTSSRPCWSRSCSGWR